MNPAATIAFKQDFWSILGQTIALAAGLLALSAVKVRDSDILCSTRKESSVSREEREAQTLETATSHGGTRKEMRDLTPTEEEKEERKGGAQSEADRKNLAVL